MTWLLTLIAFAVGLVVGAVLFKYFKSDEARVKNLEEKLSDLEDEHERYKDNVHAHFNNTAQLLNRLTDSYRDVYRHMATGAQSLCPDYISEQLTHSAKVQESLGKDLDGNGMDPGFEPDPLTPPRDYADRSGPNPRGALDEEYGLDKIREASADNRD